MEFVTIKHSLAGHAKGHIESGIEIDIIGVSQFIREESDKPENNKYIIKLFHRDSLAQLLLASVDQSEFYRVKNILHAER